VEFIFEKVLNFINTFAIFQNFECTRSAGSTTTAATAQQ
jgi:hypothetical protein